MAAITRQRPGPVTFLVPGRESAEVSLTRGSAAVPLIAGIGEVLWDILPEGPQLGGAPANFTYFAKALGADALLIEVHPNPAEAWSDGAQQLTLDGFRKLMSELKPFIAAAERE